MKRKFIESISADNISIMTDTGWEKVKGSHVTIEYKVFNLVTDRLSLQCADDHIVFKEDFSEVFVKDLEVGDLIQTVNGLESVTEVYETDDLVNMHDLEIDSKNHRYYTDGILSHNTTLLLDGLANAKKNGAKVLFVSGEMNQVDLYLYVQRFPKFGDIEIFFPQELAEGDCPKVALQELMQQGWDIVLFDSFVEVQEIIKEAGNMSGKQSEKWMLDLMGKNNLGHNDTKRYTSFLNIQQVTKGGKFVGSNRLKHMTTGMMEIRFVEEGDDDRYVFFDKNRRGNVGKRMYFSLHSTGDVTYDLERFNKAEKLHEMQAKEKDLLKDGNLKFEELFKLSGNDSKEANGVGGKTEPIITSIS